jgi:hypothetical protein
VTRKAWIETDQFDLEAIAAHLQSGDITVVREGDGYYLTSPEIDAAAEDAQANEIVAKIISRINALGRIHDANFREVKLSRYTDDTGRSVVTGVMGATLQPHRAAMTGTVTDPGGSTVRMAWLEGNPADLQDLANLLASGQSDVQLAHEGDAYYLTAPTIDNPPEGTTFYDAARRVIDHINGLARVMNPSIQAVRLSGRYTQGESEHVIISPPPMEARIRMGTPTVIVTKPDGTIVPAPPSPWPGYLALAATNPDVADVLEMMNHVPLGWGDLFKIHEKMALLTDLWVISGLGGLACGRRG